MTESSKFDPRDLSKEDQARLMDAVFKMMSQNPFILKPSNQEYGCDEYLLDELWGRERTDRNF
jgi:hypothetical protein